MKILLSCFLVPVTLAKEPVHLGPASLAVTLHRCVTTRDQEIMGGTEAGEADQQLLLNLNLGSLMPVSL